MKKNIISCKNKLTVQKRRLFFLFFDGLSKIGCPQFFLINKETQAYFSYITLKMLLL